MTNGRKPHYIKTQQTTTAPTRFIFVDTEGCDGEGIPIDPDAHIGGNQYLWFGCAEYVEIDPRRNDRTERCYFRKADEFWDWVESLCAAKHTIWIVAHNWNYDACLLSPETELLGRGWECTQYINGKPPVIIRWRKGQHTLKIIDSLNYFATSLAQLGKGIGEYKLDSTALLNGLEAAIAYCWQDVNVVKTAILTFRRFVIEHDLGAMQHTLAGQAMSSYRRRFMAHQILVHDDDLALTLEREAYHGGRTESFYSGAVRQPLWKLDINSMYPSNMVTESYSARLVSAYIGYHKESFEYALSQNYGVVARCLIQTDEECYGVVVDGKGKPLPCPNTEGIKPAKLIFPIGEFWATLSTPEIRYGLAHGHIKTIESWAQYERDPIFVEFVRYFYARRLEYRQSGNSAFDHMSKIMLNSLYGKFGQTGIRWEATKDWYCDSTIETAHETDDGEIIHLRSRLGQTQIKAKNQESRDSCPMIAAEITAYSRMQLWRYILIAGKQNVYYVDTDSLVVNKQGLDNLAPYIDANTLGMLKIEKTCEMGMFFAPKHYTLDDEWKIKGVSRRAILSSNIATRQTVAQQAQFRSYDVNLRDKLSGACVVREITKTISGRNSKRVVAHPGWTKPIILGGYGALLD